MSYNFQNILNFISVKTHSSIGIEFTLDCSDLDRKDYKNNENRRIPNWNSNFYKLTLIMN